MTPITRVHYRERQRLRTADLATEQLYLTQARRRHNIAHHTWGIVWGLSLAIVDKRLFVQPGVAIDGYGRELILPSPMEITGAILSALTTEWDHTATFVDVWLVYNEVTYTPAQRGRVENCYDTRINEQACLRFTEGIAGATAADRRKPDVVPEENWGFQPWQTPPDDWMNIWPVYLGQFRSDSNGYHIDINNRPYAALTGERVTTPSGQGSMELVDANGITRRFTLNLADSNAVITKRFDVQYSEPLSETRATIWGNTTIKGDLNVGDKPNVEPLMPLDARGLHFGTPYPTPEKAAPWQLYRTQFKPKDAPPETKPIDQLRLEIFDPGQEGNEKGYGFSIGHWHTADGSNDTDYFQYCLRLTANCTVELAGKHLDITGQLLQSPIPADPNDPRFVAAMIQAWVEAIALSSSGLDLNYSGTGNASDSDLQIVFNGLPTTAASDVEIGYSLTVDNTGESVLGSVKVMVFAILPDGTIQPPQPIGHTIQIMQPHDSVKLEKPPTITAGKAGVLSIGAFATAITIKGDVIKTTVIKTLDIT